LLAMDLRALRLPGNQAISFTTIASKLAPTNVRSAQSYSIQMIAADRSHYRVIGRVFESAI